MAPQRHVLIAIPTTSQSMKAATALTLAQVALTLQEQGFRIDLHNIDSAEIVTARDMFANMVLHSSAWTDLLFIDSDMHFDPRLVVRMAALNVDFAGAAYTRRALDLRRFVEQVNATGDLDIAAAHASDFTFKPNWSDTETAIEVVDGFCSAAAVGMGCALISKSALMQMVENQAVQPRLDLEAGNGLTCWSFFAPLELDGVRLGEDYSFSYRWTAILKKQLWVCIDEAIGHMGGFEYRAKFSDRLAQSSERQPK